MTGIRVGSSGSVSQKGTLRPSGTYAGIFDPSSGLPTTGTGRNGTILKGDFWQASGAGTIASLEPFTLFASGDLIYSNKNNATAVGDFFGNKGSGGSSMTYPGAGIPLSTGSAWDTSITNNSSNWNTAFGWGNHASAGYLTSLSNGNGTTASGSAVDLGGTVTANTYINSTQSAGTPYWNKSYIKTSGYVELGNEVYADYSSLTGDRLVTALYSTTGGAGYYLRHYNSSNVLTNEFTISGNGIGLNLGSDASGDTYYRNSSGYLTRLAAGTNGHVLTLAGGIPSWAAPASGWALTGTTTLTGASTIAGSTTNTLQFDFGSLGTTYSNVFMLNNPTAAAAGAQQISPALTLRGNGWKTNATAASQTVDFIQDVTPVQGAASPTGYMSIWSSINGAARSENVRFRNDGAIFLTGGSGFAANIFFGTAGDSYISRGTSGTNGMVIYGPSNTANIYTLSVLSNSTNYAFTGTGGSLALNGNWVPTIGAGNMYYTNTTGTINMTGTSSGNVFNYGVNQTVTAARGDYTGFYHNPTITSVTGVHYSFRATSGLMALNASVSGSASFRIPHGTAPSSPVDGDIWTTTAGLYVRINGATVGPLT